MDIEKLKKGIELRNSIINLEILLKEWSGIKISDSHEPMPEGTIKMWNHGGVAAFFTIDVKHAQAIKTLHIVGYKSRLTELKIEFNNL